MNPWRPYPLIRLAAAFITGIFTAILHLNISHAGIPVLVFIIAAIAVLAIFPGFISSYRYRWIRGALGFLALVLLGNQHTINYMPGYFHRDKIRLPAKESLYIAVVSAQPAVRAKTVRIAADVYSADTVHHRFDHIGSSLLYVKTDAQSCSLKNGDAILVAGIPALLPSPATPGGFDMRQYFARQGIFFQIYVPAEKWRLLDHAKGFSLARTAGTVREKLLKILQQNGVKGEEFAVAGALLLGYVSEIDRELLNDYSSTGAMHILSVSGMHVGVIYLFLEFLLGFIERRRKGNEIASWFRATVMVLSIWAYALITGLSPPVQRAAIMLSMVIIGKNLKRQPDILNILAGSLLIILLSDPFLVLDTGCQFSYLAVAGIVLMYKPVYDLYVTSHWFPDKVWSLIAVSVSAQMITFPLGLYVFHQFPNYFLLTNLLAVPLSSFIIYAGIMVLAVGSVPWLGPLAGKALSMMVMLLNSIVRMIDSLPYSVTRGLFISLPEMFLLYAMTLFFFLFFLKKKKLWLFLLLASAIMLAGSLLEHRISNNARSEMVICQGKTTNIDFIYGDRHFLLMEDPLKPPDDFLKSNLANHWASKGIIHHFSGYMKPSISDTGTQNIPDFLHRCGNCFLFCGRRIVILNDDTFIDSREHLHADIVVICNGCRMNPSDLHRLFNAGTVVAAAQRGYRLIPFP